MHIPQTLNPHELYHVVAHCCQQGGRIINPDGSCEPAMFPVTLMPYRLTLNTLASGVVYGEARVLAEAIRGHIKVFHGGDFSCLSQLELRDSENFHVPVLFVAIHDAGQPEPGIEIIHTPYT